MLQSPTLELMGKRDFNMDSQTSTIQLIFSGSRSTIQEGMGQNTKLLCDLWLLQGYSSSDKVNLRMPPITLIWMQCLSQLPLPHLFSDACKEPAADWKMLRNSNTGWSALNLYIQFYPSGLLPAQRHNEPWHLFSFKANGHTEA